jgi:hypothetical protein
MPDKLLSQSSLKTSCRFQFSREPLVSSALLAIPHGTLLGTNEARLILGVSLRTLRTIIARRQIDYFRVRGRIKFDPQHLNTYLAKRRVALQPLAVTAAHSGRTNAR